MLRCGVIQDGVRLFSDLYFRKRFQGFQVEDNDRVCLARGDEATTELRCHRDAVDSWGVRDRSNRFEGICVENFYLRGVGYIDAARGCVDKNVIPPCRTRQNNLLNEVVVGFWRRK